MHPYSIHLGTEPQRVLEKLAVQRHQKGQDVFGPLGHVPSLLTEAVVIGLAQLAQRELDVDALTVKTRQWLQKPR